MMTSVLTARLNCTKATYKACRRQLRMIFQSPPKLPYHRSRLACYWLPPNHACKPVLKN